MMGNGMMSGNMGMWMGVGAIFWVVLIAGVIALIVWAVGGTSAGGASPSGETALEILQKRYARGEITSDQYEDIKRGLSNEK